MLNYHYTKEVVRQHDASDYFYKTNGEKMEKTIASIISAFAGIMIALAFLQAILTLPLVRELIESIVAGLMAGAFVAGIIGIALLFFVIKGR